MHVDVLLGEAPVARADVADRVVVVIDVLRAATTTAIALSHGATAVIPFETVGDATTHADTMDRTRVRLCGERHMRRVHGFDLGNSPGEYTVEQVSGRTMLFTTTNGTAALTATHGARACLFAGFVNARATVDALTQLAGEATNVTIICAGAERQVSLEDAVCAGRIVRQVCADRPLAERGDGARLTEMLEHTYQHNLFALATDATHARSLASAGFADDLAVCLAVDTVPFAVRYEHGALHRFPTAPI